MEEYLMTVYFLDESIQRGTRDDLMRTSTYAVSIACEKWEVC